MRLYQHLVENKLKCLVDLKKGIPLARGLLKNGMVKTGLTVALGITLRGAMI